MTLTCVHIDMIISVRSAVLMPEPHSMSNLMNNNRKLHTTKDTE